MIYEPKYQLNETVFYLKSKEEIVKDKIYAVEMYHSFEENKKISKPVYRYSLWNKLGKFEENELFNSEEDVARELLKGLGFTTDVVKIKKE